MPRELQSLVDTGTLFLHSFTKQNQQKCPHEQQQRYQHIGIELLVLTDIRVKAFLSGCQWDVLKPSHHQTVDRAHRKEMIEIFLIGIFDMLLLTCSDTPWNINTSAE